LNDPTLCLYMIVIAVLSVALGTMCCWTVFLAFRLFRLQDELRAGLLDLRRDLGKADDAILVLGERVEYLGGLRK
jgi:hypothetical protein